jgi:hypothetical protein
VPFLPPPAGRARLTLKSHRVYPKSGIVAADYEIVRSGASQKGRRKKEER